MKDEVPGFVLADMVKYVGTTAALLGDMDLSPEIKEELIYVFCLNILDAGDMLLDPNSDAITQFCKPRIKDILQFKSNIGGK